MASNSRKVTVVSLATVFQIRDGKIQVLLLKTDNPETKGRYELPTGAILPDEDALMTVQRRLKEIVVNPKMFLTQFHTFTDPKRVFTERSFAIGHLGIVSQADLIKGAWIDARSLPLLAFDHNRIIADALAYLRANLSPSLARHFLPSKFPLNQFQEVYELINNKSYDNRNFRRKLIDRKIVTQTNSFEKDVSHRPAKLYRFSKKLLF